MIGDWNADGTDRDVAHLHVHHADDEAWHVVSGALQVPVHRAGRSWPRPASVLVPRAPRIPSATPGPPNHESSSSSPFRLDG